MVSQNYLFCICFTKPVIIKTYNFEFENVPFTKRQEKKLIVRHVTKKCMINLK